MDTSYQGGKVRGRYVRFALVGGHQAWYHLPVHRLLGKKREGLAWPRLPLAGPGFFWANCLAHFVLEMQAFYTNAASA